ncbi:hypothetical protein F4680DRAFT_276252 [Xylaria scruposa]|nr:hypothetical protein F4680DRAFT_276252 [Xylaria scruposa]
MGAPSFRCNLSFTMVRPVAEDDLGLKTLYHPPPGAPIKYDIVAIHGIGAHPDDTWCKTIDRCGERVPFNWLSDKEMLPAALPNARIMRFGAKTQWFGEFVIRQTVSTVTDLLLGALTRDRKNQEIVCQARPLIFIAHCFGGLVVMKTLLDAANSREHCHIFNSVTGIAFMGTPFRGAEQEGQKRMVIGAREVFRDVYPGILRINDPYDEMRKEIVRGFMQKREELRSTAQLVCFYELEFCDVMVVVDKKKTIRVDSISGCLDVAKNIPLQRNHYNMNKFGGPNEETYKTVQEMMVEMANRSNPNAQHDASIMQRGTSYERQREVYSAVKPHCCSPPEAAQTSPGAASANCTVTAAPTPLGEKHEEKPAPEVYHNVAFQGAATPTRMTPARTECEAPSQSRSHHDSPLLDGNENSSQGPTIPEAPSELPDNEHHQCHPSDTTTAKLPAKSDENNDQPNTRVHSLDKKKASRQKQPSKPSAEPAPCGTQEETHDAHSGLRRSKRIAAQKKTGNTNRSCQVEQSTTPRKHKSKRSAKTPSPREPVGGKRPAKSQLRSKLGIIAE